MGCSAWNVYNFIAGLPRCCVARSPTLSRNANGDKDDEDSSEYVLGLFNVKRSTVTSNPGSVGLPTVARQLIPYQLLALQDDLHVTGLGTRFIKFCEPWTISWETSGFRRRAVKVLALPEIWVSYVGIWLQSYFIFFCVFVAPRVVI